MSSLSPSVWQQPVFQANWIFKVHALSLDQMSPLHWAADKGHVNTVKCLVEKGGEVNSKDGGGVSK